MLDLFGLTPDESIVHGGPNGPYRQSERLEMYQKYLHDLVKNGHAYYCFCTSERLDDLRKQQEELKLPTKYDGRCRDLPYEESRLRVAAGESYTIRLKVPKGETIVFDDVIRGKIEFKTSDVDDQVLLKSDGFPSYHGAIIIDDYLMGVTDMLRGEEWISSIPKQVLTARAFGWQLPRYGHLPNILGKDGKKLSKRDGDVSARSFLEKGYLVDALINYIAFLGWNPKTTQEIFTREELVQAFSIEGINKAGATWDTDRLDWMNSQWIQKTPTPELMKILAKYLETYHSVFFTEKWSKATEEFNALIVSELKTRLKRLEEFPELTKFFYGVPAIRKDLLVNAKMKIEDEVQAIEGLRFMSNILPTLPRDSFDTFKQSVLDAIAQGGRKNGQILWPVRVALSGEEFSPGAIELMWIL